MQSSRKRMSPLGGRVLSLERNLDLSGGGDHRIGKLREKIRSKNVIIKGLILTSPREPLDVEGKKGEEEEDFWRL